MAGMNAEYINPFLMAATSVLQNMCMLNISVGKPYVKTADFNNDSVVISIGVTGDIKGQVLLVSTNAVACQIASKMVMMPVEQLDELTLSALSELGNMILGNAATVLSTKGIGIDITPPSIMRGDFIVQNPSLKNLCVPLNFESSVIELNMFFKE